MSALPLLLAVDAHLQVTMESTEMYAKFSTKDLAFQDSLPFKETTDIWLWESRETHRHTMLVKNAEFWMSQQVVHVITTGL
jgi:hypothetical protein